MMAGFWSNLIEGRAIAATVGPPRDPVIADWLGQSSRTASGVSVTPDSAMRVTAVYRAVSVIAQTMAALPLKVFQTRDAGGADPMVNHPLYRLLHKRPNRWQTSFEWREMMFGHLCLRGVGYNEIVSSPTASVAELVPLHPDHILPFRAPDGRVAYDYQPLSGPRRIILQHEMHTLRGLSLDDNLFRPLSPIALHRETIGLSIAAREYQARFFSNNAAPKGALTTAQTLTDKATTALREAWERRHQGLENQHRIAILDGGLEWKQIGMTNEDAQFIEQQKFTLGDIGRIFGVPAHFLGDLEKATFSNIEQQSIEFVVYTLLQHAVRHEQTIGRDLIGEENDGIYAKYNLDGLLRGDFASRMQGYAVGRQWGWWSSNDIRAKENENPIENGNEYLRPLNMVPAGTVVTGATRSVLDYLARALAPDVESLSSKPPTLPEGGAHP